MLLFRILLSPFVLIYGLIFSAAGMLFPFSFIMIASFAFLIISPFIWLLNKSGANIKLDEPLIGHSVLGHFVSMLLPIWLPFYIVYIYIVKGTLFTGE